METRSRKRSEAISWRSAEAEILQTKRAGEARRPIGLPFLAPNRIPCDVQTPRRTTDHDRLPSARRSVRPFASHHQGSRHDGTSLQRIHLTGWERVRPSTTGSFAPIAVSTLGDPPVRIPRKFDLESDLRDGDGGGHIATIQPLWDTVEAELLDPLRPREFGAEDRRVRRSLCADYRRSLYRDLVLAR